MCGSLDFASGKLHQIADTPRTWPQLQMRTHKHRKANFRSARHLAFYGTREAATGFLIQPILRIVILVSTIAMSFSPSSKVACRT